MFSFPLGRYQGPVPVVLPIYAPPPGVVLPGLPSTRLRRPLFPPRRIRRQSAAAPTFVASTTGSGSPTNTTNVPTGTTENDLLVWFIKSTYGTRTDPTNWELLDQTSLGAVWFRLAPSSPPGNYTVTTPAASVSVMHTYRGVDLSDPILAFRTHAGSPDEKTTDPLFFQTCDYIAASFNGQVANLTPTAPSGWTQAGSVTGVGGGGIGCGGAYRTFTATEGCAASAAWGGNVNPYVVVIALRGDGNTVLSLKGVALVTVLTDNRPMVPNSGATTSSLGVSLTPGRRTGDLEVVVYFCKFTTGATAPSFNTPSGTGWAKHGSDQIYTISAVPAYNHIGMGIASRIISDGSGCTVTTAASVTVLSAYTFCFATGTTGPDASIVGTKGQSTDTSNDTTQSIPAMVALEDYVENNFLMCALGVERGDASITAPAGFEKIGAWQSGTAGNQTSAIIVKSLGLNGAADPGALSATSNISQRNVAIQFAVGVVLDGAGYRNHGYLIGA